MTNQTFTHTPPEQEKPAKQELDHAPIWPFVLPFLVIFLALGGNQKESFANDSSLYAAEIPAKAAFVRVVYFGTEDYPEIRFTLQGQDFALSVNQASQYVLVDANEAQFSIEGANHLYAVKPKEKLSIALGYNAKDHIPVILGQISKALKKPKTKKTQKTNTSKKASAKKGNKARLHLYNFHPAQMANLEATKGNLKVIPSVKPNTHGFREVNPITVALQVAGKNMQTVTFEPKSLKAQGDYSFFVHENATGTQVIFTRDSLVR